MNSLIQHMKPLCKSRDSLSLYVEYCGDNIVRVHRQFYIYNQFASFLMNDNYNIGKLDFKDATNDISFTEFLTLLNKLIHKRSKSGDDEFFVSQLASSFNEIAYLHPVDYSEETIDKCLEIINEIFCKFHFSVIDGSFHYDEGIYYKVNELLSEINYNPDIHYDDYKQYSKPVIAPATENELYELRIYNVGQANCSALIKYTDNTKNDYKVVMVFDLGFQRKNGSNAKLEEMINKIDFDTTILISHYDNDHINNITNHLYLSTNRWLFPNYNGRGKKALKTFQTLLKAAKKKTYSKTIYNFPTPFNLSPNISIHQFSGSHKGDPYQSTFMNSKCLVCKLSIGDKDVLIPADALYEEFEDDLILPNDKKYDYVLIPHHGCKYINRFTANPSLRVWKYIGDNTIGFAMCGKNTYGHANENHMSWYNNIKMFNNTIIYDDGKHIVNITKTKSLEFFSISFW